MINALFNISERFETWLDMYENVPIVATVTDVHIFEPWTDQNVMEGNFRDKKIPTDEKIREVLRTQE